MSENEETATALDRIRGWREEYRLGLAPSPLEDVTQLSAQLDLTHAHPSGIAQLFAKGHVTLDSLFRDNGMLRAAGRRVERVLDDRDAKSRVSGVGDLSLVVGVAIWKGNQMPVLMYPVEVRKEGRNIENGTVIAFTGRVRLNAAFAAVMPPCSPRQAITVALGARPPSRISSQPMSLRPWSFRNFSMRCIR